MKHLLDKVVSKSNDLLESEENIDIIGFIQNTGLSEEVPAFALMNISEAYNYDGLVVATDLDSAEKILTMPGPKHKMYYISELEWVGQTKRSYRELLNVYQNTNLKLIAASDEIAKDIYSLWNMKVFGVVADFDVGEIYATYKTILS